MGCKIIIEDTNKLMDSKMNICIQGLKKFQEIKIILETNCFYNINAPMNWSENTVWLKCYNKVVTEVANKI